MRHITLCIIGMLCLGLSAHAQDKVVLSNGNTVNAKITELGTNTITYKVTDITDGPVYTIPIEKVLRLEFADGKQMYRTREYSKRYYLKEGVKREPVYGNNVISVMPVALSTVGLQHGIAYERNLDSNGTFGLFLPFNYVRLRAYSARLMVGRPEGPSFPSGSPSDYQRKMVSFSPTLKIYLTGSKGAVKYSAGIGIYAATGQRDYYVYKAHIVENVHHLGFFVHNALNLNVSDDLYIGFEATTGYYKYFIPATGLSERRGLVGADLRLGYRF